MQVKMVGSDRQFGSGVVPAGACCCSSCHCWTCCCCCCSAIGGAAGACSQLDANELVGGLQFYI